MDFTLNDEQRQIYEYGGQLAQKYDNAYWLDHARKHEFPHDMFKQIADDGFLGIMVPEEYGGAGLGMTEMALFMEGTANHGIPLLMMVVGPTMSLAHIASHGSEFHKKELLPAACRGDIQFCFAITEPGAGSNTMKATTLAKRRGNRFSLSGEKTFITGAEVADYCLVVARTKPHTEVSRKTDGFTLFAVDLKKKGVEKQRVKISIPLPEEQWTLFFDEVDLGPEDVVGEVDEGFSILFDSLNPERIILAALCCGIGRFALNKGVAYVNGFNIGRYWLTPGQCSGACAPPVKNGHCYMHVSESVVRDIGRLDIPGAPSHATPRGRTYIHRSHICRSSIGQNAGGEHPFAEGLVEGSAVRESAQFTTTGDI